MKVVVVAGLVWLPAWSVVTLRRGAALRLESSHHPPPHASSFSPPASPESCPASVISRGSGSCAMPATPPIISYDPLPGSAHGHSYCGAWTYHFQNSLSAWRGYPEFWGQPRRSASAWLQSELLPKQSMTLAAADPRLASWCLRAFSFLTF